MASTCKRIKAALSCSITYLNPNSCGAAACQVQAAFTELSWYCISLSSRHLTKCGIVQMICNLMMRIVDIERICVRAFVMGCRRREKTLTAPAYAATQVPSVRARSSTLNSPEFFVACHAGGRNVAHKRSETTPQMTLHAIQRFPHSRCSTRSQAAAQYVKGVDAASRRIICVCAANKSVRVNMRAWIACGASEGWRKGDFALTNLVGRSTTGFLLVSVD